MSSYGKRRSGQASNPDSAAGMAPPGAPRRWRASRRGAAPGGCGRRPGQGWPEKRGEWEMTEMYSGWWLPIPLKNTWKSIRTIIPNWMGKSDSCSKPPTSIDGICRDFLGFVRKFWEVNCFSVEFLRIYGILVFCLKFIGIFGEVIGIFGDGCGFLVTDGNWWPNLWDTWGFARGLEEGLQHVCTGLVSTHPPKTKRYGVYVMRKYRLPLDMYDSVW